jgi:hypothetical protein
MAVQIGRRVSVSLDGFVTVSFQFGNPPKGWGKARAKPSRRRRRLTPKRKAMRWGWLKSLKRRSHFFWLALLLYSTWGSQFPS